MIIPLLLWGWGGNCRIHFPHPQDNQRGKCRISVVLVPARRYKVKELARAERPKTFLSRPPSLGRCHTSLGTSLAHTTTSAAAKCCKEALRAELGQSRSTSLSFVCELPGLRALRLSATRRWRAFRGRPHPCLYRPYASCREPYLRQGELQASYCYSDITGQPQ